MKRQEIEREIEATRAATKLDEDLRFVDLLCVRWAYESEEPEGRQQNAIYRLMRLRNGAVYGGYEGMSDTVLTLDVILAKSDPRYLALCSVWYKDGGSVSAKAKALGTNRTDLYALWRRTLEYLKGRLHGEGIEA